VNSEITQKAPGPYDAENQAVMNDRLYERITGLLVWFVPAAMLASRTSYSTGSVPRRHGSSARVRDTM